MTTLRLRARRRLARRTAQSVSRRSGWRCFVLRGFPWPGMGGHKVARNRLGFSCEDCMLSGGSYDDLGLPGQVSLVRKVYDRDRAAVTRTSAWEKSARGW